MEYIKKAPLFLLILFSLWYAGLFGYFNQGVISIEVPYIGNFRIALAIVVLASFLSGAVFASIFFAYDSLRKSLLLRSSKKTINTLKSSIDHQAPMTPTIDQYSHDKAVKAEPEV